MQRIVFFANGQANEKDPEEGRYLAFVDEEQGNQCVWSRMSEEDSGPS